MVYKCHYVRGCVVNVKGLGPTINNYQLVNSLFPSCEYETACGKLYIKNSEFVGSLGDNGWVINCEDMHLELENYRFSLKENSTISPEGGFIYHRCAELGTFSATNVTFDASAVQSNTLDFHNGIMLHFSHTLHKHTDYVSKFFRCFRK